MVKLTALRLSSQRTLNELFQFYGKVRFSKLLPASLEMSTLLLLLLLFLLLLITIIMIIGF